MIPSYPDFAGIELRHEQPIEMFIRRFEPYSDFNFMSLYSWNTNNTTGISFLNGNLVIRLSDYLTEETVYSILGDQDIDNSLSALFKNLSVLKLVPEVTVKHMKESLSYSLIEDRDNFDYIYALRELSELPKNIFGEKKKKANKFARRHKDKYKAFESTLDNEYTAQVMNYILDWWHDVKGRASEDSKQEREAIHRLMQLAKNINLIAYVLTVDENPVGFSIFEALGGGIVLSHFHKTLTPYKNADVFFNRWSAGELVKKGYLQVNWEQDLGIEGLRQSKMSYRPNGFLKKYTIRPAG